MTKIVSIIPARGGSKGIPRKNIIQLGGIPLIAHTITSSLKSKYVNETYVSTDDDEIAKIAEKWGSKVVYRPKELATDTTSSEDVLLHFSSKVDFDILVFLQCTSPLTSSNDIDNAIKLLMEKKHDSILSVCQDHGGFLCGGFIWNKEGSPTNYDYKNRPRRQDIDPVYKENGAIYITWKENLLKSKMRLSGKVGLYIMPTIRSFEIDSPQDFLLIERIFHIISPNRIDKERLSNIKMVIFDVDGVFTDGSVFLNEKNKEIIKFSRIDGKGIEIVQDSGIKVAIITSEDSNIVRNRMNKLNISDVYCGIKDKEKVYNMIKTNFGIDDENICYCGDDIQDIKILKKVGFACCPQNAQLEAKKNSHYISTFNGGKGFVRDVCNILTSVREKNVT